MRLHDERELRVVVDTRTAPWAASPERGVDRILLERDGGEIARATSIVRYAPGAAFRGHEHGEGEEMLVLEGELRDEHGTYPAGTYLRNPWGTRHSPHAPKGCVLFVKLRQMPPADRARIVIEAAIARCTQATGNAARELVLHATGAERVSLVRWPVGHRDPRHDHTRGEEILVIEGDLADEHGIYRAGTWLRQPTGSSHAAFTSGGCLFWVKRGPG